MSETLGSIQQQGELGRWVVRIVPQLGGIDFTTKVDEVKPVSELLLPVWVPENANTHTQSELPKEPSHKQIVDEVARKFPHRSIEHTPIDSYTSEMQLNKVLPSFLEPIVVVELSDSTCQGLNAEELQGFRGTVKAVGAYILGQTIRPTDPSSTVLREADSLNGLFGLEDDITSQSMQSTIALSEVA